MRTASILFVLLLASSQFRALATSTDDQPPYKQSNLPIEDRIHDLVSRMTIEEKARQLDMYAGVPDLVDKSIDKPTPPPTQNFRRLRPKNSSATSA